MKPPNQPPPLPFSEFLPLAEAARQIGMTAFGFPVRVRIRFISGQVVTIPVVPLPPVPQTSPPPSGGPK